MFSGKMPACCVIAIVCIAGAAAAQTPASAAQPAATAASGPAVATPTYTSIPLEITVNRPAAEVWKRVGKFCDIGEWLQIPCTITSGKDGEFGAVRSVAGEVLVGKTEMSYTYTQTVRNDRPYNLYHGTLEARPLTATTSKIVYTIFFDNSMLADDAARATDRERRTATFQRALQNMKLPPEIGLMPGEPFFRANQNQLIPSLFVGTAQAKGSDPEDLFHVTDIIKGTEAAGTLEESGCKMVWPA